MNSPLWPGRLRAHVSVAWPSLWPSCLNWARLRIYVPSEQAPAATSPLNVPSVYDPVLDSPWGASSLWSSCPRRRPVVNHFERCRPRPQTGPPRSLPRVLPVSLGGFLPFLYHVESSPPGINPQARLVCPVDRAAASTASARNRCSVKLR